MSITTADADYVRELVRERSAIVIDASKTYLIESRLGPVVRSAGLGSIEELISRMRRERTGPLADLVVDAMTTNETFFFRDATLWAAIEKQIVPQLKTARQAQRALTVWCAACSSGQEPYSIAMMLIDRFPDVARDWNVRIIATDLSAEMLGRAAAGRYTQLEVNRGLPAVALAKHFRRDGAFWQISDQVRSMVEFRTINLIQPWPFIPAVDLLMLRNVLIYFDTDTKKQVLARARTVLRPDGHLVLGTSETTLNLDERYARIVTDNATTYQPR
ncbi:MAG: protein-glutamate O-methyltransferase CheR [Nitriliruptoraceae bacterium]|nr:protein-glutamate O-methyltransferase CheR [Nitriliruptoraceae bacterium]